MIRLRVATFDTCLMISWFISAYDMQVLKRDLITATHHIRLETSQHLDRFDFFSSVANYNKVLSKTHKYLVAKVCFHCRKSMINPWNKIVIVIIIRFPLNQPLILMRCQHRTNIERHADVKKASYFPPHVVHASNRRRVFMSEDTRNLLYQERKTKNQTSMLNIQQRLQQCEQQWSSSP